MKILCTLSAHFEVDIGDPLGPKSMFPKAFNASDAFQGAWSACKWLQMLPKALNHVAWLSCPCVVLFVFAVRLSCVMRVCAPVFLYSLL